MQRIVGQTIALDRLKSINENDPPNCYLGGLLLFVAYYDISDCYYTTYDADNCFNRNNSHSPSQKYSTKVCDINLPPTNVVMVERSTAYFIRLKGKKVTPTYSLQIILQHFCQNKSSYFEIYYNAKDHLINRWSYYLIKGSNATAICISLPFCLAIHTLVILPYLTTE